MDRNPIDFDLARCKPCDLAAILRLQQEIMAALPDADLLRCNSPDVLQACLSPPHLVLGAWHHQALAGIAILYCADKDDENLGIDMGLPPDQLCHAANLKLVMVAPAYRGHSLQIRLCRALEQVAAKRQIRVLCATVSPNNQASIRNFKLLGYHFCKEVVKYNGLRRALYYKELV